MACAHVYNTCTRARAHTHTHTHSIVPMISGSGHSYHSSTKSSLDIYFNLAHFDRSVPEKALRSIYAAYESLTFHERFTHGTFTHSHSASHLTVDLQVIKTIKVVDVAWLVEYLPSKHKALSIILNTT